MSRENVELVESLQPSGVDLVQVFSVTTDELVTEDEGELFTDDFEVRFIADDAVGPGFEARGGDGLRAAWHDWLTPYQSYRLDVERFIDSGDDVIVFVRVQARTLRDGVLVEHAPAAIWKIREGRVAAIHFYLEREEALEAAGVAEEFSREPE